MKGYWECNKGVKTKQQEKKTGKQKKKEDGGGGGEKGEGKMTKE